jgi:YfiR/HmsC-like
MGTVRALVRLPAFQSIAARGRDRRRPLLALWSLSVLAAATAARTSADEEAPSRLDQLMAGYVLNFTKFVEWPEAARPQDLTICVAGNEGLYEALLSGATSASVGSRHVTVRKVDDAPSTRGCHVLYIEPASALHLAQLTVPAPMLTVSDGSGFAHAGGTIELFTQQNRLRFIINLENAKRAGLRISSNLLQLAASVEGEAR